MGSTTIEVSGGGGDEGGVDGDLGLWEEHPKFPDFQYVGYCSIQSHKRQELEEKEKTSISATAFTTASSSSTSTSNVLCLRMSSKHLRLLDLVKGVEILPCHKEDEDLLASLKKVLSSHWMFTARVKYAGENNQSIARVRIDVYLSSSLWMELSHLVLEKSHVKRVFGRLSLSSGPVDAEEEAREKLVANIKDDKGNILSKVFSHLPKHKDLVSKNFIHGQFSSVQPVDKEEPGMWLLPGSALQRIIEYLDNSSLGKLAATCKYLHSLCCIQVPGLRLKLYFHQKIALFWMLGREGNPKSLSLNPDAKEYRTGDGFSFWVDNVNSKVYFEAPERYSDCRGGFLCDEPGMGKTVTAISLILRTKSCLPKPPKGCVPIFSCQGSRQGFYEMENHDTLNEINIVKGTRNNRSSSRKRRRNLMNGISTKLTDQQHIQKISSVAPIASSRLPPQSMVTTTCTDQSTSLPSTDGNLVKEDGTAIASWVQCDACKKWRLLSENMNLDKSSKWFCRMSSNPDLQEKGCAVPEQQEEKGLASNQSTLKSLGYISIDKIGNKKRRSAFCVFDEENVQFFISVLKSRKDTWKNIASAIHYLANCQGCHRQLRSKTGLNVPHGRRDPSDYGAVFESLGLVRTSKTQQHNWIQPLWIGDQFKFDQTALSLAIEDLAQVKVQYDQIFLSSATLIVVPTHLIPQWKVQLEKCCGRDQVSVYTYTKYHNNPMRDLATHELAWNFDVVLTTFQVLSTEWSFRKDNSILMKIHWLRIILDEGHSLGSSLGITNKHQMACCIKAERRWIMTGTPTPETVAQGAAHLLPLLKFLHEPQYGLQPTIWHPCIQKPLEAGKLEGAQALTKLLSRVMIHASKSDLETIPKCHHEICKLDFDPVHAKNYNEFVAIVQRNLLLADWWDEAHMESLMHSSKRKEMTAVVRNIRLSCNLAGHMKVHVYLEDVRETMMIITQMRPSIDPIRLAWIERALKNGAHCERCKEFCRVPIVTPRCAHVLCVDCIGLQAEGCVLCNEKYLMEKGQYSPKRAVPVELIELQPSYSQDEFYAPTWVTTASVKTSLLLRKLEGPLKGEKVIIFSQFQEHLRMIEEQLEKASVRFAGLFSSNLVQNAKNMRAIRAQQLDMFENDVHCQVLLMDGICSHGLDLSFCSNVLLMEPIFDLYTEEQVICRAHRMGQKREVRVETFVMANTIEEQVISIRGLNDDDNASFEKDASKIYELRKARMLLSHLRTVCIQNETKVGELQIGGSPAKKGDLKEGKLITPWRAAPPVVVKQEKGSGQNGNPVKRKVKFADENDDEANEDIMLLSTFLTKFEEVRSKGLGLTLMQATIEGALLDQIAMQGKESAARVYFLLVSSYWPDSKATQDIYLLKKEKHPRYMAPRTFEMSREFPDWFMDTLAKVL